MVDEAIVPEPTAPDAALFLRLSNPYVYPDKSFSVRIETTAGAADVRIPASEIGEIINFLVAAATHAAQDDEPSEEGISPKTLQSPIAVRGLGLGYGSNPAESLLWVKLAHHFALSFSLDSKKLAELGDSLSQILKTLSADPQKKQ